MHCPQLHFFKDRPLSENNRCSGLLLSSRALGGAESTTRIRFSVREKRRDKLMRYLSENRGEFEVFFGAMTR